MNTKSAEMLEISDDPTKRPYATPWQALVASLATHAESELSDEQATERRSRHGPNELAEAPPTPAWKRFLGQFKELVIWILIVAAVISGVVGDLVDTVAI